MQLGHLDKAIHEATHTLKEGRTVVQKVAAQHQLGSLYSEKAHFFYSRASETDLQSYVNASRQSANAYLEVSNIAGPIKKADKVILLVQDGLFHAGRIYYSIGSRFKSPQDLQNALPILKQFVAFADQGVFSVSAELTENVKMALTYAGLANFELGVLQIGTDKDLTDEAIVFLEQAAVIFKELIRRFPMAKDAPLWQYRTAECYSKIQQYQKAIAEYNHVISAYPGTKYADLSCVQIGKVCIVLAEEENRYLNTALDFFEKLYCKLFNRSSR